MSSDSSQTSEERIAKLWTTVRSNPNDFTSWTTLISEIEKTGDNVQIRDGYSAFLAEYPLCYVYWKKLADLELAQRGEKEMRAVFEASIGGSGASASTDLWSSYADAIASHLNININTNINANSTNIDLQHIDKLQRIYERAIDAVGFNYVSYPLWSKLLTILELQGKRQEALTVYYRALRIPLERIDQLYNDFKEYIDRCPVDQLPFIPAVEESTSAEIDGEDFHTRRKRLLIEYASNLLARTHTQLAARKQWETEIQKRSYFHAAPLKDSELEVWHQYLTYEENLSPSDTHSNTEGQQRDIARIEALYERCLVVCCNYPEYWSRYAAFEERRCGVDKARRVYERACTIYAKRRPQNHLEWALFEESHESFSKAKEIYTNFTNQYPLHLESAVAFAHFLRRTESIDAAIQFLTPMIERLKTRSSEKESYRTPSANSAAYVLAQIIRLYRQASSIETHTQTIRQLFESTLMWAASSRLLWMGYVSYELSLTSDDSSPFERVSSIYDRAVTCETLTTADRDLLFQAYLQCLNDFGPSADLVRKKSALYRKAFPQSLGRDRKRIWEGDFGSQKNKSAKTSAASTPQQSNAASSTTAAASTANTNGTTSNGGGTNPASITGPPQPPAVVYPGAYAAYAAMYPGMFPAGAAAAPPTGQVGATPNQAQFFPPNGAWQYPTHQ